MMRVWLLANCAARLVSGDVRCVTDYFRSTLNLQTDGVLRLLDGDTITLCDADFEKLKAALPNTTRESITLRPIDIRKDDAFVWSPFADICSGRLLARDQNLQLYPYSPPFLKEVFGSFPVMPVNQIESLWCCLVSRLQLIEKKICVIYTTDLMSPVRHASFKPRVEYLNALAEKMFGEAGWKIIRMKPEASDTSDYWAHYSYGSMKQAADEINSWLGP